MMGLAPIAPAFAGAAAAAGPQTNERHTHIHLHVDGAHPIASQAAELPAILARVGYFADRTLIER